MFITSSNIQPRRLDQAKLFQINKLALSASALQSNMSTRPRSLFSFSSTGSSSSADPASSLPGLHSGKISATFGLGQRVLSSPYPPESGTVEGMDTVSDEERAVIDHVMMDGDANYEQQVVATETVELLQFVRPPYAKISPGSIRIPSRKLKDTSRNASGSKRGTSETQEVCSSFSDVCVR